MGSSTAITSNVTKFTSGNLQTSNIYQKNCRILSVILGCIMIYAMQNRLRARAILGYMNKAALMPAAVGLSLLKHYTTTNDNNSPVQLKENPFAKEKVQCILCKHSINPDYKNVQLLSQFQSPYTGRVYGRHITGLCKNRHEQVEREIIKAQNSGLMPIYHKAVEFLNDPKLFDPEKAFRPHKY